MHYNGRFERIWTVGMWTGGRGLESGVLNPKIWPCVKNFFLAYLLLWRVYSWSLSRHPRNYLQHARSVTMSSGTTSYSLGHTYATWNLSSGWAYHASFIRQIAPVVILTPLASVTGSECWSTLWTCQSRTCQLLIFIFNNIVVDCWLDNKATARWHPTLQKIF